MSMYNASKFGLRGFALAYHEELRGTGVGVSLIAPGFVDEAGMFADSGNSLPPGMRAVSPGDVAAQATQVMANLAVALDAAGVGLTDVAKTTVFVASTQRDDRVTAWRVIRAAFGGHEVPSRLQGVMVLGYPEKLVEVRAIAVAAASSGAAVTR
jgi:NAD(P)-dependent dehydrogenase (short-subunit alcohol dehydrogenase family)